MSRRGITLLAQLRGEEGFGLIEAALVGITAGVIFIAGGKAFWDWSVGQTAQEKPPPNVSAGSAPLAPPPSDRDEQCVRLAYETQGLIFSADGNPARFEPPNAMWFIPGIVSGPGSVYTQREVEAKVKHRYFLAQKRWTRDCEQRRPQDDLPEQPPPQIDQRQLYYGTYTLTWIDKVGSACGPAPETQNLPTTLMVASPGESIGGVMITFGGPDPIKASLGGDRFNTPGEDQGSGNIAQLSGTFVERGGRIEIESGRYEFFQGTGSTVLCTISYTGIK
jgi:hypothetical protein